MLNDLAYCVKCDTWIADEQPWQVRSHSSWQSSDLMSTITSYGVIFVPIGYKGSPNETTEWRISFSVAEKLMIYSFSHTQVLCYALMKLLLKEIISKVDGLNDLLCSYFIKTMLFWMFEESEQSLWIPENIKPCSTACIKRLLYCVEYSIMWHYLIIGSAWIIKLK